MISELDATAAKPTRGQKRRGVKPETTALIAVGEAPRGFWVVTAGGTAVAEILAVLVPKGLAATEHFLARGLAPSDFGTSQSLAKAWGLAEVWCDPVWRADMHAMAMKVPVPFPKAQRLLFA